MAIEVAACEVVVLGSAGICMTGEDLGVAEWDAGIEYVGGRSMSQGVDLMWRYAGELRDPGAHSVGVASVDGFARSSVTESAGLRSRLGS